MESVSHTSQLPLYKQVAEKLENGIATGRYPEGKLPPELNLAKNLQVSTTTIKQSLNLLVHKGLIYRRPRQGTFIRKNGGEVAFASVSKTKTQVLRWLKLADLAYVSDVESAIKDRFEFLYPRWRLEVQSARDIDPFFMPEKKLIESAHVITFNARWFSRLFQCGVLTPLNSFKERFAFDQYFPEALNFWQREGSYYALPCMLNTASIYYNRSLFEENSIEIPSPDCTWEQLCSALCRLSGERKGRPVRRLVTFKDLLMYWENFIWQHGGDIFEPGSTCCAMDKPEARAGLAEAQTVLQTFCDGRPPFLRDQAGVLFQESRAQDIAAFMGGPIFNVFLRDAADDWAVRRLPSSGLPARSAACYGTGISRSAQPVEQAAALLDLIAGDFGQQLFGLNSSIMPAFRPAAEKYFGAHPRHDFSGFLDTTGKLHFAMPWVYDPVIYPALADHIQKFFERKSSLDDALRRIGGLVANLQPSLEQIWTV
ncbi:MAG: extracellular solute-binding protein [Verrucomicrobiae bacterium]|nr:extracellular solute-binding protein [Verrucomicrobiae bacterium]